MPTIEARISRVMKFQTEPISAYTIQQLTKANYSSIRVTLRRMVKAGNIRQNDQGLYVSVEMMIHDNGLIQERLRMHGINLRAECNSTKSSLSSDAASDVTRGGHRHNRNHSITYNEEWNERTITITHHDNAGVILVALMSGDNDLEYTDFLAFCSFLQGRFPKILLAQWEVVQLGINWDTDRIQLQGVQKLSLQHYKDLWFNIYRREDNTVRIEAHTTKKMGLAEILETFALFVQIVDAPTVATR